jgi:hypothetical protein
MRATAYPSIDRLLDDLLDRMQQVLGQNLVGLYLYGSLVTGDFDPGISDIDLLCVVSADVDEAQFARLHAMHDSLEVEYPEWKGRIEVQYVSIRALQTFWTQSSRIATLSPGEPFHFKPAGRDYAINWHIIRRSDRTLYGKPPHKVIPPISKQEYLQVVREHARMWLENEWEGNQYEQSYAILTMCRAMYAAQYGEQVSKKKAAQWVARQFPEWAALTETAFAWRRGEQDPKGRQTATLGETERFVRFAANRILGG